MINHEGGLVHTAVASSSFFLKKFDEKWNITAVRINVAGLNFDIAVLKVFKSSDRGIITAGSLYQK